MDEDEERLRREELLEHYPNIDSMTKLEKLAAADQILDKILDGARAWQDPELNPPEAKPLGEMLEAFASLGRALVSRMRAEENKH